MKYFGRRIIVWLALVICCILLAGQSIYACSCMLLTTEKNFTRAAVVFSGKVDSVKSDLFQYSISVNLSVSRVFKGPLGKSIVIRTAPNDAACGYPFKEGEEYLVYGEASDGGIWVSLCGRTKLLSQAGEEIKELEGFGNLGQ